MNSFGHLAMHIAQANNTFCAKISGQTAPDLKIAETDSKDKLVAAIKDSFAFCTTALANVDDSKLGEQFVLFGNRPISREVRWWHWAAAGPTTMRRRQFICG